MSWWQKLSTGFRFLFGGWESAFSYVLSLLNGFLESDGVAGKVAKGLEVAMTVLYYAKKYRMFCLACWADDYDKTVEAVEKLVEAFSDGKVDEAEVSAVSVAFKDAYMSWVEE